MANAETAILNNYLVVPSQLPAFVSLKEFTELFPRVHRTSPLIRTLYRDLQAQRNETVDQISSHIEIEVKSSKALRQAVVRARRQEQTQDAEEDIVLYRAMVDSADTARDPKQRLQSILPRLEDAAVVLEKELEQLEKQEAKLIASVQQTVGNLSDLRYGKLGNSQIRDEILEGHANLQETCKRKI